MSGFLASYLFLVQLARKLPHWRGAWCFASDHAPPVHVSGSDEHGEAAHARPPRTGAILCASLGFYVFHRFWRLTPMVLMGIALFVVIAPLMGSGPFWQWAYTVETWYEYRTKVSS
ncbi:MAG: hypothetical protein EOO65_01590 [Methanosarcinales archaeon]|nr:MAG: hypothetical protein EOO65_01590 [Methanosarcinales archaeon]